MQSKISGSCGVCEGGGAGGGEMRKAYRGCNGKPDEEDHLEDLELEEGDY
jgi:hypothetical protein